MTCHLWVGFQNPSGLPSLLSWQIQLATLGSWQGISISFSAHLARGDWLAPHNIPESLATCPRYLL